MNNYDTLSLAVESQILTITLNRPDKLNAINIKLMEELKTAFEEVADDQEVGGIIITGSGDKAFVAGADISEIAGLTELHGRKFAETGQEVFTLIENSSKPVIAAINGFALGAGSELALACHIRLASNSAKFGLPEVKLGLIPGYGGTQRLPKLVGKGRAMEMILTGEMISAERALEFGLVNALTDGKEELMFKARTMMQAILNRAPLAIANAIDCINKSLTQLDAGLQSEANAFANCCKTEDFVEGTTAFLEKREAKFEGK